MKVKLLHKAPTSKISIQMEVNSSVILGFQHFVIRTKQLNISALKMGGVGSSNMLAQENWTWPRADYCQIKQMDLGLAQ